MANPENVNEAVYDSRALGRPKQFLLGVPVSYTHLTLPTKA